MRQVAVRLIPSTPPGTNEANDNRVVFVSRRSAYYMVKNGDAVLVNPADAVPDGEAALYASGDRMRRLAETANAIGPIAANADVPVGVALPVNAAGQTRQAAPQIGPTRAMTY